MQLVISERDAGDKALLQTLGSMQQLATPQPERQCTYTGAEIYKSFFMFNSVMISRLTLLYLREQLAFARGVCVNMAVAHRMLADAGSLVYAETLMAGPIDCEDMAGLTALWQTMPCCCVQYRRRDGPKQTVQVYAMTGQCAKLAPPTPLGSQPGSSCQSFLFITAVAWFPGNSWPKVQNALAPISDLHPFVCAGLLGLGTPCSS